MQNRNMLAQLLMHPNMPTPPGPLARVGGGGSMASSGAPGAPSPQTQAAMILGSNKQPDQKAAAWQQMQAALPAQHPEMGLPVEISTTNGQQGALIDAVPEGLNWSQRLEAINKQTLPLKASGQPLIGNVAGSWYFDPQGGMYQTPGAPEQQQPFRSTGRSLR